MSRLTMTAKCDGDEVELNVTDFDEFIHAAPSDLMWVRHKGDGLILVAKGRLSDFAVDGDAR